MVNLSDYDQQHLSDSPTIQASSNASPELPKRIVATAHPAIPVVTPDARGYMVRTDAGHIPVETVTTNQDAGDRIEPAASSSQPPPAQASSSIAQDLPSASSGQGELRTKMRVRDERQRTSSAGEAYPQDRVTRVKNILKSNSDENLNEVEAQAGLPSRHLHRGPGGRFLKRK